LFQHLSRQTKILKEPKRQKPLPSLEEVSREIIALEQEGEGLIKSILGW
jgi:hypothetical protein